MLLSPRLVVIDSGFFVIEEIYQRIFYALIFKNLKQSAIIGIPENTDFLGKYYERYIAFRKGHLIMDCKISAESDGQQMDD